MARPKMTEKQKAEAKAARDAAKAAATAGAPGAADRAEARSAAKNGKPPTAAQSQAANSDDLDREEKSLFLQWLPQVKLLREALNTANSNLRNAYKKAKAEGAFTKTDFDTAFALETAEKEAKERAKIARALKIAKIVGSELGNQLDLFSAPDRTPAADRAFEEGQRASMENKPAKPPYDPSTEQFRQYMAGFHEHQATLAKGIKPTNPAVKEDVAATAQQKAAGDQQRAQDAEAFDGKPPGDKDAEIPGGAASPPATPPPGADAQKSGQPMTRAQFKAQQEAAKAAGKPN